MGYQDTAIQQMIANNNAMQPIQMEQMRWGLDTSKKAYGQAQEDRGFMLGRRGMLETAQNKMSEDATAFNTEGRREQLAAEASADVAQSFSQAAGQQQRGLAARGVNPNSGRALAMSNQTSIQQAMAQAGASNKVRQAARAEGYALTDRASNALSGYPAMGMAATGAGAGFGASGLGMANSWLAGMNSGQSAVGGMAGSMGSNASGMYGAMGSYKNNADQIAASNDPMKTILGAAAGVGTAYGMDFINRPKDRTG
jgi:hypothetical protein